MFPRTLEPGARGNVAVIWATFAFFCIELYAWASGALNTIPAGTYVMFIVGAALMAFLAIGAIRLAELGNKYGGPHTHERTLNAVKRDLAGVEVIRLFEDNPNVLRDLEGVRDGLILKRLERKERGEDTDQLDATIRSLDAVGRVLIAVRPN